MERLKRKLKSQGVSVFDFSKETQGSRHDRLCFSLHPAILGATDNPLYPSSMPVFSAVLAIDESATFYTTKDIFSRFRCHPHNQPSTIVVYEHNIFDTMEVANFYIQNSIPEGLLPLCSIKLADLSAIHQVCIVNG
jgi:hypothetical protein